VEFYSGTVDADNIDISELLYGNQTKIQYTKVITWVVQKIEVPPIVLKIALFSINVIYYKTLDVSYN